MIFTFLNDLNLYFNYCLVISLRYFRVGLFLYFSKKKVLAFLSLLLRRKSRKISKTLKYLFVIRDYK